MIAASGPGSGSNDRLVAEATAAVRRRRRDACVVGAGGATISRSSTQPNTSSSDWEIAALSPPSRRTPTSSSSRSTEDTLAQFPYRSPVDRAFLANLLKTLAGTPPARHRHRLPVRPADRTGQGRRCSSRRSRDLKMPLVVSLYRAIREIVDAKPARLSRRLRAAAAARRCRISATTSRDARAGSSRRQGARRPLCSGLRARARGQGGRRDAGRAGARSSGTARPTSNDPAVRGIPGADRGVPAGELVQGQDRADRRGSSASTDRHRTPFASIDRGDQHARASSSTPMRCRSCCTARYSPDPGWLINLLIAFAAALRSARVLGACQHRRCRRARARASAS